MNGGRDVAQQEARNEAYASKIKELRKNDLSGERKKSKLWNGLTDKLRYTTPIKLLAGIHLILVE